MWKRLTFCVLFTSLTAMVSCTKDETHSVRCTGDDCSQEKNAAVYPVCQDEDTLILSEDGDTMPCPNGCVDDHCVQKCTDCKPECTDDETKCLSDKILQSCVDGSWVNKECEGQCVEGECVVPSVLCHDDELRCSGSEVEICRDGEWKVSETCATECRDGKCLLCIEDELRCSDLNVEICHDGQWVHSESCEFVCHEGKCMLCLEGEQRCSDLNLEVCHDNQWTSSETCPYECLDGQCIDDCRGTDICRDETTLQQCIDNKWTTKVCENGCNNGKCEPKTQVDRRLTNKICSNEGFWEGFCDDLFEEGAVCVEAGPSSAYCLARCDPKKPKKYYCEGNIDANVGDCLQVSDGSYALIPTRMDYCAHSCSSKKGCDSIEDSYEIFPVYCDDFENYCDGSIVHQCKSTMDTYDCGHYSETCVQFESRIFCAQPCDVEGRVIYECFDDDSVALTCVLDDNGTLSFQPNYGPIEECSKGCNEKTGKCK